MKKRIIPRISGYTKIQVISFVKMKVAGNISWARGACLAIYGQQNWLEQKAHLSKGHDGRGFSRCDAPILSHIACKIKQNRCTVHDDLTLEIMMPRYAGQLICIAYDKDKCKKLGEHLAIYYHKTKIPNVPF